MALALYWNLHWERGISRIVWFLLKINQDFVVHLALLHTLAHSTPPDVKLLGRARQVTLEIRRHSARIDDEGRLLWESQ